MDFLKRLFAFLFNMTPVVSPIPTPEPKVDVLPGETAKEDAVDLPKPAPLPGVPIKSLGKVSVLAIWHDWFKSDNGRMNEFTDGTDKATPARRHRILYETDPKKREDLPPAAIVRLAADGCVQPQEISPVPHNEFQYHVVILDEKATQVLEHIILSRAEQDSGSYFKSVPTRWTKTNGWEVQLKFIPQKGNARKADKVIRWYMTYRDLQSEVTEVSWRHANG